MHPVTDEGPGTRIAAGEVTGEQPGPGPGELIFRVFSGQAMGQHQGYAVVSVDLPDRAGVVPLLLEFRKQGHRQSNDSIVATFGPPNADSGALEVEVFDAQIERFRDAETAAIEQAGNEVGGIPSFIADSLEERLGLGDGGGMALLNGAFGAEGIDVVEWLSQHVSVKEKDGVEGLVLRAGRQVMCLGQVGEEAFEFLFAGEFRRHVREGSHVAAEPKDIGLLCGEGLMLSANDLADAVESLCGLHVLLEAP